MLERLIDRNEYIVFLRSISRIPFISLVEYDENRALDGLELRREYEETEGLSLSSGPCSVLEVLIALARRMAYIEYDPVVGEEEHINIWFWDMLTNLGIDPDLDNDRNIDKIILWIERKFERNGRGSPFPLQNPVADQRKVEIWYQMQAYLAEKW